MSTMRSTPPSSTSTRIRLRPLSRLPKAATRLPSGEKARSRPIWKPMVRNWPTRYWKSLLKPRVRLRTSRRLRVSKSEMSSWPRSLENDATRSPEGEAVGDISWLGRPRSMRKGQPKSPGSPVRTSSGRYFLRSQRRNSVSNSSGSTLKARCTARPTRPPMVLRSSYTKSRKPSSPYSSSM